ncbi:site-2 protease family protein [Hoyosella altamirensis]|uniref:Zinc metalloprotease n=1 Tax=Hoyosella altamirensis TaxID=616997 RepID=A0A839RJZ0_9ACTN|nr:site-2 protease family protein [Hoyosella altamirensis]MBB3037152.1 Zn-dependent protease/predicted transcriptional regulator [Hoyosella altamirensis]
MDRGRVSMGTVRGIPIGAHWSVLAIFGLITIILATSILPAAVPGRSGAAYAPIAIVGAVVFLASLLAHELAHAIVAQKHGVRVKRITLWLLGGVAELEANPRDARAEFRIAIVGPVASMGIAIVAFGAAYLTRTWLDPLMLAAIIWLGLVNAIVAVFNMLPGAPLDGGRVLRAFLWRRTGDRAQASLKAAGIGRILGFSFIALGLIQTILGSPGGLWLVLIGWFMLMAASAERATETARAQFTGIRTGDVMSQVFDAAPEWWCVDAFLARTPHTSRGSVFPVVRYDGEPVGVVSGAELWNISEKDRVNTTVGQVARPLPPGSVVGIDADLGSVVTRTPLQTGQDIVVVMDGSAIAGVLTAEDVLRHMLRRDG